MQIILNSDTQIKGHRAIKSYLELIATESLRRFGARVIRLDAHLADDNSAAKANVDDIHCTLEAQVNGLEMVIAKDRAATAHLAIQGAVGKLERAIAHAIGKHRPSRAELRVDEALPDEAVE